jgi:hypothetical protein
MGLVPGMLALNVLFLAAGYCVLAAPLAGLPARVWASYAGLALLLGAALAGVGTFLATIAGATARPATLAAVLALVAAAGLALRSWPRGRTALAAPPAPARGPSSEGARLVALAAGYAVVVVCALALVGGFRSSPWLDDVWGIWLPKGVALAEVGLDLRLFAPNSVYVPFEVLDYPLWWSILLALDMRFVGEIDLRAADAQLAILFVSFVAAAARLLWGHVRPLLLTCGLLLLAASPELLRHVQGGIADLPLAIYLALFALALAGWVAQRRAFWLLVAGVSGAAAVSIKSEGLPQLLVVAALIAIVAAALDVRALPGLGIATGAAVLTAVPWLVWRSAHDVPGSVSVADALDPGYLVDRAERVGPTARSLATELLHPHWLLAVPLVLVLGAAAARGLRRPVALAPALLVAVLYGFWVWAYWAESEDVDYLLTTSAYRVVDTAVLVAWLAVPLLAEALLSQSSSVRHASSISENRATAGSTPGM